MKRVLSVLGAILLVYFAGRALYRATASDEQKIRWAVEGMFEGYNTTRPGLCVAPIAEDWRHESIPELDRELLRGALFRVSMQERDRQTKELTTRIEMVPDSWFVNVAGDTAEFELEAFTSRRTRRDEHSDPEWVERWRFRIVAQLEQGDGGWRIVTSRHEDLGGTQLSR